MALRDPPKSRLLKCADGLRPRQHGDLDSCRDYWRYELERESAFNTGARRLKQFV
jgi:hypothetical protein